MKVGSGNDSAVSATYLAKLNPEQRRAVEHGVGSLPDGVAKPLLVIAGAGSGKTNTLARLHQVDAIFAIFGAFDRDKRLILKSRG